MNPVFIVKVTVKQGLEEIRELGSWVGEAFTPEGTARAEMGSIS